MRGKHATAAAIRRDAEAVEATVETYKRHNARLVNENRDLKSRMDQAARIHAAEVRALKAQMNEGLSPEVAALRRTVDRLREERDAARRDAAKTREVQGRAYTNMHRYVMRTQHMTGLEATELMLSMVGPDYQTDVQRTVVMDGEGRFFAGKVDNANAQELYGEEANMAADETEVETVDRIRALQRARGQRRRA